MMNLGRTMKIAGIKRRILKKLFNIFLTVPLKNRFLMGIRGFFTPFFVLSKNYC